MPNPLMPQPTPVFHITAIDNLAQIFQLGEIRAKNHLAAANLGYQNIAYQNIQGRRASRVVAAGPGGQLHDYVPFYFAPRSPMLMAINGGSVPGCAYRQRDIVHIKAFAQSIVAAGRRVVFYDRHAVLDYSIPCDDIALLGQHVAWDLLCEQPALGGYCKYWQSVSGHLRWSERKEKRQAEFLVHQALPIGLCVSIGVADNAARIRVTQLLGQAALAIQVAVIPEWYY